ncbi:MAG: hypothetical protein MUO43_15665 [Desulfobacterales bacterium]|nr:hypothetical protein [Desulfobacterales bacterium]
MRITTKTFRNVSIALFLVVSLLVVGGFTQETKKLQQKPSSPYKGDEKAAVDSASVLLGPMKAPLNSTVKTPLNPSLREPVFRSGNKPAQSDEEMMDEEFAGVQKKRKKVTVDDDGPADYPDIQAALADVFNVPDGTDIEVMPGTYAGFIVDGRYDLKIKGKKGKKDDLNPEVIVTGSLLANTYRGDILLTIGVIDSIKIEISNFTVFAGNTDPHTIAYFNSTGKVKDNDVSGNTGNANPGNSIAVVGITSPGTVEVEHNFIHNYGKIGIWVNSWDKTAGVSVPSGIYAEIKHNTIVGTDFADYYRVQDGIQVIAGASAKIEDNNISLNFQTDGSYWTCDAILIQEAFEVETKKNKIYDNQMGITIQTYVTYAKLEDDDIEYNEWGIYTWNPVPSTIEVKKANCQYNEYGWVNWDTDGIVFEHCDLEKNMNGLNTNTYELLATTATFNHCKITKNTEYDVIQGPDQYWYYNPNPIWVTGRSNTLIFNKTKYDTYSNEGGGILIVN